MLDREPETVAVGIAFDAPAISILLLQDALTAELATELHEQKLAHPSDVVSAVSLNLVRPNALFLKDHTAIGGQLKLAEAVLEVSPSTIGTPRANETELRLSIADLDIDGDQQLTTAEEVRLHASTGETKLQFVKSASELVLGSVLPWLRSGKALAAAVARKRTFSDAQQRYFVERLAHHCHRIGTWPTDPSFTTRACAFATDS